MKSLTRARGRWVCALVLLLLTAGAVAVEASERLRLLRALDGHRYPEVRQMLVERPRLRDAWAPTLPPEPFLDRAIETGNPDLVSAFLDAGTDPTALGRGGQAPLHRLALREGAHDALRHAASLGYPLDVPDARGRTPLQLAVTVENGGAVVALLDAGASVSAADPRGWTPLHIAALLDRAAMMKRLCTVARNVNPTDRWGWTPLDWAESQGNDRIAEILEKAGGRRGPARLDIAAEVRLRVLAGAPVRGARAEKEFWGFPPLHWAALFGDADLAVEILERGGDLAQQDGEAGWTPLHFAAWRGDVDTARLLLENGAEISPHSDVGYTPLHLAVWRNHPEMLGFLLDAGADVNIDDLEGETPLHESVYEDRPELMRVLIRRGARVDAADRDGRTPLHAAAENERYTQARILVAAGADRTLRDEDGRIPYDWAVQKGNRRLMRLLDPAGRPVRRQERDPVSRHRGRERVRTG